MDPTCTLYLNKTKVQCLRGLKNLKITKKPRIDQKQWTHYVEINPCKGKEDWTLLSTCFSQTEKLLFRMQRKFQTSLTIKYTYVRLQKNIWSGRVKKPIAKKISICKNEQNGRI